MSNIKELAGLPELSFIDNKTQQDIRDEMLSDYISFLKARGEPAELPEAHPDRLVIYATAAQLSQLAQYIDRGVKQNFLKYAVGDALDNLAAFKKIERLQAQPATTTLKFTLSAAQSSVIIIPGGTRVRSDSGVDFSTDAYAEVPAGELTATVTATALKSGTESNGVAIGEIKTLVDPVGYVASVENITVSAGGSNIETDGELTLRVYNAPHSWSVAGPLKAYEYWAENSRADIADVEVCSPDAMLVDAYFVLDNGVLPDEADCRQMEDVLRNKEIRPMTDLVTARAPVEVKYKIDVKYFICASDEAQAMQIQNSVNDAARSYQNWQCKIGRDINPSKLCQMIMMAGAKRVEIVSPEVRKIPNSAIPKAESVNVIYGGIEDD